MAEPPVTVLHLITGLGQGGAEAMLARLVTSLDPTRTRSIVVSMTGPGVHGPSLVAAGIPLHDLEMTRGAADLGGAIRLIRLLRRLRPDVVQTWLYHADLLGVLAARTAGLRAISWNLRCSDMDTARYHRLQRLLALTSRLVPVVVANSQTGRKLHAALGYRPQRWEVIPNGFDLTLMRPNPQARAEIRVECGIDAEAPVVGMLARWDPMKDHKGFLAAAAAVAERHGDAHFLLAGDGIEPGNTALVSLAAAHPILTNRLHLLGRRSDVPRLTAALDVACLASFGEGFPNVLGEALACGVPCVATDVGDSALVVGDAGVIVPPRDPAALAAGLLRLLALAPAERHALGAAGRQRIERDFSLPAIAERYAALYRGLAAGT